MLVPLKFKALVPKLNCQGLFLSCDQELLVKTTKAKTTNIFTKFFILVLFTI